MHGVMDIVVNLHMACVYCLYKLQQGQCFSVGEMFNILQIHLDGEEGEVSMKLICKNGKGTKQPLNPVVSPGVCQRHCEACNLCSVTRIWIRMARILHMMTTMTQGFSVLAKFLANGGSLLVARHW